jgi:hypothetical protein
MVAETVRAHGGDVQLLPPSDAAPTRGAHFRIHIPHALPD